MADLDLKKEDLELDLLFDLVVEDNDVEKDDTYITASLLSIFTELSEENIKAYEDGLRVALQWLLDDKIVAKIEISTEKDGNRLNIQITFTTDSENQDNLIYSLDEKLEILS